MSVKHALLALLSEHDRHGYDLRSALVERSDHAWQVNIGQIYTTLDRLERDGLAIRLDPDADGRVPYRITEAGRAEADAWLLSPVDADTAQRDTLSLKVALALTRSEREVRTLLTAQRDATMARMLAANRARREVTRDARPDPARILALERTILSAEAEVRWLDFCEANLATLRPTPTPQEH